MAEDNIAALAVGSQAAPKPAAGKTLAAPVVFDAAQHSANTAATTPGGAGSLRAQTGGAASSQFFEKAAGTSTVANGSTSTGHRIISDAASRGDAAKDDHASATAQASEADSSVQAAQSGVSDADAAIASATPKLAATKSEQNIDFNKEGQPEVSTTQKPDEQTQQEGRDEIQQAEAKRVQVLNELADAQTQKDSASAAASKAAGEANDASADQKIGMDLVARGVGLQGQSANYQAQAQQALVQETNNKNIRGGD